MEITIRVPAGPDRVTILGPAERNLKMVREALGVAVTARSNQIVVRGERGAVTAARRVLDRLVASAEEGSPLARDAVLNMIADEAADAREGAATRRRGGRASSDDEDGDDDEDALVEVMAGDEASRPMETWDGRLNVYAGGRRVTARTPNQERYLQAIRDHDLVFGIGPAGTGKTYLAVAAAVHLMKSGQVQKVILARPAVEAGERLGFLPGDLEAKINPYLRPLLDALHDMMDYGTIRRFMENDVVEVVPLAFMRGRTLNNAVIILDEAQNATRTQMKMFLTRLGRNGKMIVTGDATQTDLPESEQSGLIDAMRRLAKTPGVAFVGFERADVVRHPLVQRVIDAYDDDQRPDRGPEGGRAGTRGGGAAS